MPNVDTPLSRAATAINKELVYQLRPKIIGRNIASVNPYLKDNGKSAYEYTHISSMSDGFVQMRIPSDGGHADTITETLSVVNIPYIYKTFEIPQADITTWESREVGQSGENALNVVAANIAGIKVLEQEEEIIWNGWKPDGTEYKIRGFSNAAANTVAGGSIATAGTLTQYVADAIGMLESDKVIGENNSYNLSIPTNVMARFRSIRYTNGDYEIDHIKRMLGDGELYVTPYLHGTGLVTPVDTARTHFEFLNPVDIRTSLTKDSYVDDVHLGVVRGTVYELFTPSYLRQHANGTTDAICTITSLAP